MLGLDVSPPLLFVPAVLAVVPLEPLLGVVLGSGSPPPQPASDVDKSAVDSPAQSAMSGRFMPLNSRGRTIDHTVCVLSD